MKWSGPYNYKRKNQLLWVVGFLFLLVVYQLAFKKTLLAYQHYRSYKDGAQQSEINGTELVELKKRARELDQALALTTTDTLHFRENVLAQITDLASRYNLLITAVPHVNTVLNKNGISVSYASFFIEGDFIGLLKLTEGIEKAVTSARISSASFALKKERTGAKPRVVLKLQLSQILMNKNDI